MLPFLKKVWRDYYSKMLFIVCNSWIFRSHLHCVMEAPRNEQRIGDIRWWIQNQADVDGIKKRNQTSSFFFCLKIYSNDLNMKRKTGCSARKTCICKILLKVTDPGVL